MNLQWVKTARGEALRDLDLPENAYLARETYSGPQGVGRVDRSHIACTVPQWTPGARRYVTDRRSCHYGQPIVESDRDRRNIEAATNGQFKYDRSQEQQRSRIADARRKAGIG